MANNAVHVEQERYLGNPPMVVEVFNILIRYFSY